MHRPFPTVEILGIPIARLSPAGALVEIERICSDEAPALIAYANAHTLNLAWTDPDYRRILGSAAIVLNDGAGVALAARAKGTRFPANLNGSDFNPRILGLAADKGWRVYLLGARPGVAERAAGALQKRYRSLQIVGFRDGYWPREEESTVVEAVRASDATLLMVALGNPRQEEWLDRHLGATGARIGVGVGAFFDFTAGEVPRAPAWMNRWGIEWVYRLLREPGRLWRRYVLGNPLFLLRVLRDLRPKSR
jgi:exopolysaccharide biosynthesis WecB/TagA/CpsF family protein